MARQDLIEQASRPPKYHAGRETAAKSAVAAWLFEKVRNVPAMLP